MSDVQNAKGAKGLNGQPSSCESKASWVTASGRSKAVSISSVSEGELSHAEKRIHFPSDYAAAFGPIAELSDSLLLESNALLRDLCIGDFYDEDTLQCSYCQRNFDDADGFLCVQEDDYIHLKADPYFHQYKERTFRVLNILGQGTFGTVVKCVEVYQHGRFSSLGRKLPLNVSLMAFGQKIALAQNQYAIKIIRNIPKYRRAARKELEILEVLRRSGKSRLTGCIPLLDAFEFRHHVCMIFPLLAGDLYSVLERNKFRGIVLFQIKAIARQLFQTALFLQERGLIHTDLKPENIMLFDTSTKDPLEGKTVLVRTDIQLIDFGSAIYQHNHHSDLVSTRHYRAPEVILGLQWSYAIDMWSIGCILAELFCGRQLFSTHSNGEHLALICKFLGRSTCPDWMCEDHLQIMEDKKLDSLRSRRPASTVKGSRRREAVLDEVLIDPKTFVPLFKQWDSPSYLKLKPLADVFKENEKPAKLLTNDEVAFKKLIFECLEIDPTVRLTPSQALQHEFVAK